MAYLVGTDEAGYGPNFGPLVITATLWRVPDEQRDCDLYESLRDCVCREAAGADDPRLVIADSKQVYRREDPELQGLEAAVAVALKACGYPIRTWQDLWQCVAQLDGSQLMAIPWHDGYEERWPLSCTLELLDQRTHAFRQHLARARLELLAIRSAAVFPAAFNELLDRYGNKSNLLSQCTLELVSKTLAEFPPGPSLIHCDKHGGRNRYSPLLQALFPDYLVEVVREGRDQSVYRWGPASQRHEFRFVMEGETFLPAALASMVSKYLRELAMRAFNAFWSRHVPGIRRTAGYPVDAQRFHKEIATKQRELGISDGVLWRSR